ncbi:MAG: hypothetical protein OXO52_22595 [Rhodospirillales bacterium]|nr:hypothetical protein [Rhodospirillales bacterium]MDE0380548.1 hypothetical protein [Rhodospirillales bacterium]
METARRTLAAAVLACALVLAGATIPAIASASQEEGTAAPAARAIPVAPVEPESTAGRIVLSIADWLEERVGSGSDGVRLTLDAPMWAEERSGTVTVHLPGARLVEQSAPLVQWVLGDLAMAVTPRSETTYDFEIALPAEVDKRGERLTIGAGTVSGTWRSDLEIATRLQADAENLRLVEGEGAEAAETLSLRSFAVLDELTEGADGLWDGRSTLSLAGLVGEGFALGRLDAAGNYEDFGRDLILQMHGDFVPFAGAMSGPTALGDVLTPLISGRWGRSDMTIALQDLRVSGAETGLGAGGDFTLGRLEVRIGADGRSEFTDISTRLSAAGFRLAEGAATEIPPALMPHAATLDVALTRLPLRRIAEALSASSAPEGGGAPEGGSLADIVLAHLDAADSAIEIRAIRIATPASELRADGRLQVEPASVFGVIGRVDARVRGLSTLMALAAEEGEEDLVALLIVLQGLGQPVFEEGADEPFHAYEIDLRRDGAVTVNGIPFDMLLPGASSLQ